MSEKWELEELLLRQAEEWRVKKEKEEMARLAESWLTAHDRQMQELLDRFPAAAQGRSLVAVRCQCPRCQGERDSPLPRRIALVKESWAQCPECGQVTMVVVEPAPYKDAAGRWDFDASAARAPSPVRVQAPSEPPVRLRPERQFE